MWAPPLIYIYIYIYIYIIRKTYFWPIVLFLFNFFYFKVFSRFSLRFSEIGPSEFVEARSKVLYSTRATRGNQKHGISPSFYLKFEKSSVLVFLRSTAFCRSELVGAEGQIDPRIASYACAPKYWSFVKLHKVWIFT